MTALSVYACWEQARREFPDDLIRRRFRYVELMREHGHIVPKDDPRAAKSRDLPCGYPSHRQGWRERE